MDLGRGAGERVAGALRHGTVWINDYGHYPPQAEWGGFGQSGIGRELGPTGLEEYQEKKHIYHNTAPAPPAGSRAISHGAPGRRRTRTNNNRDVTLGDTSRHRGRAVA